MYRKSECFNKMNRTIGIRAIVNRGLQEPEMGLMWRSILPLTHLPDFKITHRMPYRQAAWSERKYEVNK